MDEFDQFLSDLSDSQCQEKSDDSNSLESEEKHIEIPPRSNCPCPEIFTTDCIEDRKSVFQGKTHFRSMNVRFNNYFCFVSSRPLQRCPIRIRGRRFHSGFERQQENRPGDAQHRRVQVDRQGYGNQVRHQLKNVKISQMFIHPPDITTATMMERQQRIPG